MPMITIDGREYDVEGLSEAARQQVLNLNVVDEEMRRLNVRMAICQTARNTYAQALQAELPKDQ